ncbi:MAG TPA: NAD(P)-binding domain-containing protein [Candidatus Binatia bacterium]|nr:NAD(P)-binding domain-containing protein [Candidatus Binatia bacterium]
MKHRFDYLIIGAGPAGLQLGYYLRQNQRDYLILERAKRPGSFFATYPRHRKLISINKIYTGKLDPEINMRWDWNSLLHDGEGPLLKHYTKDYFPPADVLLSYLADFAEQYQIRVQYGTEVARVCKEGGDFVLIDGEGETYRAECLVVATGLFKPYIPDFPGAELCDNYIDHDVDPQKYVNKRVLVVGKGNSAFETADNLVETAANIHICSPESVRFAWQTHFVGHLRAVNNNFLDTYQLKSQNAVVDATIECVERFEDKYYAHIAYSHAKGQTTVVSYDHVILCTGFRFDDTIFDENCRPALAIREKFPAQTAEWESANVPDLYFAGTIMQACDYKKTMSGFIHGFRYNVRTLFHIVERKYHGVDWPAERFAASPQAVLDHVLRRINNGAGIFLQPGFLADVIVIDDLEGKAAYFEDVRRDYVDQSFLGQNDHYYTVSLEYGHFMGNPFAIERDPEPEVAESAAYLHPVIRRYCRGEMVDQHHIQDDLESEWDKEVYVRPAQSFFERQLAALASREIVQGAG